MKIVLESKDKGLTMEMCGTTPDLLHALAAGVGELYTRAIDQEEQNFDQFMEAFKGDVQHYMKAEKVGVNLSGMLGDLLKEILGGCHG